ncbi:hypothetical protein A3O07_07800 [Ligilactobacillus aviarius]|nr:hypothetical protein A3O07_07800 [Ligilactobacillus aviarius]OAS81865.1 hypothetical protein A3O20_02705 [Ligilactobacillus aviarius]PEG73141.1 hypothetical protein A3P03_00010 [Ligilactobacillus aviarius]
MTFRVIKSFFLLDVNKKKEVSVKLDKAKAKLLRLITVVASILLAITPALNWSNCKQNRSCRCDEFNG